MAASTSISGIVSGPSLEGVRELVRNAGVLCSVHMDPRDEKSMNYEFMTYGIYCTWHPAGKDARSLLYDRSPR